MGVVSGQLDLDIAALAAHPDVVRRIPKSLAFRHDIMSIATDDNELVVAMEDPTDEDTLDRVRLATGMHVRGVAASRRAIRKQLQGLYGDENHFGLRQDDAPAVRAVDALHDSAIAGNASDLHIEPACGGGRARMRVDGILKEIERFPEELFAQIVSRVKLLGGLDIADRRQPQDGRYSLELAGKSIDARVSSVPTIHGEKLVIRLLDHALRVARIEDLGMPGRIHTPFIRAVQSPHGFLVVSGPTGSGKTTTLYAALSQRNTEGQNLCSVEDPVEIRLAGVTQVQVNPKAGVTFATAVRSFLRQDPNVVMVGEMRDAETASVAAAAALSGQLVMTTLHSNDAPSTVQRLLELGVARHTIATALSGVVAQRLVRRLCESCKTSVSSAKKMRLPFALVDEVYNAHEARGCSACGGTGYVGRLALFEAMFLNNELRDFIASGASTVKITQSASCAGYVPMLEHGIDLVRAGQTTFDELLRVLSLEIA